MKRGTEDTDNLIGSSVESELPAHHSRVGMKIAAPKPVGQYDDAAVSGLIFFGQKLASKMRANPQHIEDIRRRAHAVDLNRLARARQVRARAHGDRDALE